MRIERGVICEVISGANGPYDSPNVGKIVEVASLQGEHSEHGRIWRCISSRGDLVSEYGAIGIAADFAQAWLKPMDTKGRQVVYEQLEKAA